MFGPTSVDIAAFIDVHMRRREPLRLGVMAHAKPFARTAAFVDACGAEVFYGTNIPAYFPHEDKIGMTDWTAHLAKHPWRPVRRYCSYFLHELAHWTAHNKRLGRPLGTSFGSTIYSREELVAEISAAFLCWDLSLTKRPTFTNARYLKSWLSTLPSPTLELDLALGRANQATAFLRGLALRRGGFGA